MCGMTGAICLVSLLAAGPVAVKLTENAVDETAGGLSCYKIETPTATYFLEKSGAGSVKPARCRRQRLAQLSS